MAVAYVQSKCASDSAGGTTITVTLDAAVGSGNAVAIAASWNATTDTVSTMQDDKGNSYTPLTALLDIGNNSPSMSAKAFYKGNITNAPTAFTLTLTGGVTYHSLAVMEVSGVDTATPLRTSAQQIQTNVGVNSVSSGNTGSAQIGDFVFGATVNSFDWFDGTTYFSARSPGDPTFTKPAGAAGGGGSASTFPIAVEYGVMTTAAVTAATFTHATGTDDGGTMAIVFAAASGGAETITMDKWYPLAAPLKPRTAVAIPSGIIGIRNS